MGGGRERCVCGMVLTIVAAVVGIALIVLQEENKPQPCWPGTAYGK